MGTAITTISTFDYLSGQYTQPQVYRNEVTEVSIQDPFTGQIDPLTGTRISEDNHFGLVVKSTTAAGSSPVGGINLLSAIETAGGYFSQYWDLEIVENRGGVVEFEGFLQQDGRAEAIAVNTINTPNNLSYGINSVPGLEGLAFPETIAEGTTIRGSFSTDETEFSAIIEGYTLDNDYFSVEIYDPVV